MFCGKCGKEIPKGYEFCMECGAKLDTTLEQTVESIKIKKKKNWIIPVVIILLIVIIVGVAIYVINENKKKSGLYNGIPWQISYDELCELMDTKKTGEVECDDKRQVVREIIKDYKGDVDVNAIIAYSCGDDGTLRSIYFIISNGDDSKYTESELFNKYKKELSKVYGKGKEDSASDSAFAMATWKTPKSDISLMYITGGVVSLQYEDVTYDKK